MPREWSIPASCHIIPSFWITPGIGYILMGVKRMRILLSSMKKYFQVQPMKSKDAPLMGAILGFLIKISITEKWTTKIYPELLLIILKYFTTIS